MEIETRILNENFENRSTKYFTQKSKFFCQKSFKCEIGKKVDENKNRFFSKMWCTKSKNLGVKMKNVLCKLKFLTKICVKIPIRF